MTWGTGPVGRVAAISRIRMSGLKPWGRAGARASVQPAVGTSTVPTKMNFGGPGGILSIHASNVSFRNRTTECLPKRRAETMPRLVAGDWGETALARARGLLRGQRRRD